MTAARITALVVGAAAFLAALIYIGRQIGRLVMLLQFLSSMPTRFETLEKATAENTNAIKLLTRRLDNADTGRRRMGRT